MAKNIYHHSCKDRLIEPTIHLTLIVRCCFPSHSSHNEGNTTIEFLVEGNTNT